MHADTEPKPTPPAGPAAGLPEITTDLPEADVVARLTRLSKAGELPGFRRAESGFAVDAFAPQFPHEAVGMVEGGAVQFELRADRKWPWIWAVVIALSLWPGWPLTDDVISSYSDWYAANVQTWWWYVPMTLLCIPAAFGIWKKNRAEAHASALEQIQKIESALR